MVIIFLADRFLLFCIFCLYFFRRAIRYARTIITIRDKVIDAIKLVLRPLLFSKKETWVKKGENPSFDVTIRRFDGVKICERVGINLLEKLSPLLGK